MTHLRTAPPATLHGFSLVEMSVVLTLIAVIVGSLLAGLNIKHTAELKQISDEMSRMREAVGVFQSRYQTLPGDMYNATKHWGAADANFNNCKTTASTDVRTCNGDGNNMITTPGVGGTYYEAHRFWQHLSNAKLWEGRYTGQRAGSGTNATCLSSDHCGSSSFKNGLYYPVTLGESEDYFQAGSYPGLLTYPGDKGHTVVLFRNSNQGSSGAYVGSPLLNTEDAHGLDIKFDDGSPSRGFIQTFQPDSSSGYLSNTCATTTDEETAAYNLSASGAQCALLFTNTF